MIAKNAAARAESNLNLNTKKANPASSSPRTKIFNLHSNDTKEADDFKVISSEEYDKYGKKVVNKYVQYTVIGQNRTWPDFMSVKEFKKLNPKVEVKGLN